MIIDSVECSNSCEITSIDSNCRFTYISKRLTSIIVKMMETTYPPSHSLMPYELSRRYLSSIDGPRTLCATCFNTPETANIGGAYVQAQR